MICENQSFTVAVRLFFEKGLAYHFAIAFFPGFFGFVIACA